jgi:phytoene dehydrogenase-like protein
MSSSHRNGSRPAQVTIVGAGIAGLTAAIACAEEGAKVHLLEAHQRVGGRARSADGRYKANLGPHAIYHDGPFWRWMRERDILPDHVSPPLTGYRLRLDGALRRTPPLAALPAVLRLRGREAPVELDFREWAARHTNSRVAAMLSGAAGVYTFHHAPGELSAAFVWPRAVRLLLTAPSIVRYPVGGWSTLVASLEGRVRELGVSVQTDARVDTLPEPPVIVATELGEARRLLGDASLNWTSGHTVCLDLGLRRRRGEPFIVSDMDEAGWIGRYSATNPSVAPEGEELIQAQMPVRPGENVEQAALRLERLLDLGLEDWRERETWRRRQVMDGRSGALDVPGVSWRERPAIARGDGVFLAGDMVAAPGLLSEVSWASAIEASRLAVSHLGSPRTARPALHEVA